jgi:hypothetical protein
MVLVLFVAWQIRYSARLLTFIRDPLEERGWWSAAALVHLVKDWVEMAGEGLVYLITPPNKRPASIARRSSVVSGRVRARMNDEAELVSLRCMTAFSGYAWTPAGVAALSARRFPGRFGRGVAKRVQESLEMWAIHNPGEFEER